MKTQHTPGPWKIGGTEERMIFADNGDVVARIAEYGRQSETPDADKMNARLIAAAPELLAALQNLLDADMTSESAIKVVHNARIAIAKAKGE